MNQDSEIEVRKSLLYNSLNELLRNRIPAIFEEIEKTIADKNYRDVIENIEYTLENHPWGQATQWRMDATIDSHPYDESGRPFGFGGFVHLEEVARRKILHFKIQMYNDFDKTTKKDTTKIPYDKVNDNEFIKPFIQETKDFLDQFYDKFVTGAEIFVRGWKVAKAEWDNL